MNVRSLLNISFVIFLSVAAVWAQDMSRWSLGNPSLSIDTPGSPSGGGVEWAEKNPYSMFPNAWTAESEGVKLQVARISFGSSIDDVIDNISKKLNVSVSSQTASSVSGRQTKSIDLGNRFIKVIDRDPDANSGSFWAVVVTIANESQYPIARRIVDSIVLEREAPQSWALRGLGPIFVAAEMPYDLLSAKRSKDSQNLERFESNFDKMSVEAVTQRVEPGFVFNAEASIQDIIDDYKNRAGTTNFRFIKRDQKIGKDKAVSLVIDLEDNGKPYKIYKVVLIDKTTSLSLTITTDPKTPEHHVTADRILSSIKRTNTSMHGWRQHAIGSKGLFIDSPTAPKPPIRQNAVTIYNISGGLSEIEIREVEPMYPANHIPDFAAKNYFELQNAISKTKFTLVDTEKLVINGLQARLLKSTWQNGKETNFFQMLIIYGYETEWIISVFASKETEDLMNRALKSVKVSLPYDGSKVSQTFGTLGLTVKAFEEQLKINKKAIPNDPLMISEETALAEFKGGVALFYEGDYRQSDELNPTANTGIMLAQSFFDGMTKSSGIKITVTKEEEHKVNLSGKDGLHIIANVSSDQNSSSAKMQADILIFKTNSKLSIVLVFSNFNEGIAARVNRSYILSSLKFGY